jgi:hypothetical protein
VLSSPMESACVYWELEPIHRLPVGGRYTRHTHSSSCKNALRALFSVMLGGSVGLSLMGFALLIVVVLIEVGDENLGVRTS